MHLDASAPGGQAFAFTLDGGRRALGLASAGTLEPRTAHDALAKLDANVGVRLGRSEARRRHRGLAEWRQRHHHLAARSGRYRRRLVLLGGEPPLTVDDVHASFVARRRALAATRTPERGSPEAASAASWRSHWGETATWQASGDVADLNLAQLAPRFPELGGRSVQGKLTGRGSFSGVVTSDAARWLDALRGEGRMRAREGRFYQIPLIAKLLEQSHFASQAATLSNAAATFRIDTQTIHFDNAALGSESVGVQGQATSDSTAASRSRWSSARSATAGAGRAQQRAGGRRRAGIARRQDAGAVSARRARWPTSSGSRARSRIRSWWRCRFRP